jgi:UDPglucose 6-dehydrogenase
LGLAFKPNTDDVREAPAIHLIDLFISKGASVNAHDPIAVEGARAEAGGGVNYCVQMYEAINECDVLLLATEWNEYKNIDFRMVRKLMSGNIVFDGRNIFDPEKVVAQGLRYIGVGRAKEPALMRVAV